MSYQVKLLAAEHWTLSRTAWTNTGQKIPQMYVWTGSNHRYHAHFKGSQTVIGNRNGLKMLEMDQMKCPTTTTTYTDSNKAEDLVYLDFQKVFDKVPHERLMVKVNAHGIQGDAARWIRNWLVGRRQRVCINQSYSNCGTSHIWCVTRWCIRPATISNIYKWSRYKYRQQNL